jgi:hypothetical protein
MLNSSTFCEIWLTENFFTRFSGRKMAKIPEKPGFCQNFLCVFKNLAERIRNFRRKAETFQLLVEEILRHPPPNREACSNNTSEYHRVKINAKVEHSDV